MDLIDKIFRFKLLEDSVYFKVVFLLWTLIHALSLGQYISSYGSPIMIVWGGLLVIKTLFIDKVWLSNKYLILVYAFLAAYVVTIFLNRDLNLLGNIKTLIWSVIMMIALFINEYSKDKEKVMTDIYRISRAVVIATLIISGIALLQFFFNFNFWVRRVDGHLIPQGYYAARLWGIYVDPNQACNVSIISLALSVVLYINNKLLNRKILILNIIVQYLFIVLSGSRGGEIGLVFMLIGIFYIFIENLAKEKVKKLEIRVLTSLFVAFIFTFGLISTFGITRKALAVIPGYTYRLKQNIDDMSGVDKGKENEKENEYNSITVERPDTNSSNGRIQLWTDGFKLSKNAPIFGVGDRNIMVMADKLMPGSSITKQYVHNGFLHMLLSGGIVSVVIIMSLIINVAFVAWKKIIYKEKRNNEYYSYSIITIMIGSILLTTVFLTEIFYQNSFTATIFWIFMGYLIYLNKNEKFTCK